MSSAPASALFLLPFLTSANSTLNSRPIMKVKVFTFFFAFRNLLRSFSKNEKLFFQVLSV